MSVDPHALQPAFSAVGTGYDPSLGRPNPPNCAAAAREWFIRDHRFDRELDHWSDFDHHDGFNARCVSVLAPRWRPL